MIDEQIMILFQSKDYQLQQIYDQWEVVVEDAVSGANQLEAQLWREFLSSSEAQTATHPR